MLIYTLQREHHITWTEALGHMQITPTGAASTHAMKLPAHGVSAEVGTLQFVRASATFYVFSDPLSVSLRVPLLAR